MRISSIVFCCFLFTTTVAGQELPTPPLIAAHGPVFDAGAGFAIYGSTGNATTSKLLGIDSNLAFLFRPKMGFVFDFSYASSANIPGTSSHGDLMTFMGGPVWHPIRRGRILVNIDGLVGFARQDAIFQDLDQNHSGYVGQVAWGLGGGVTYHLGGPFSVRTHGEYIQTRFFDNSPTGIGIRPNIRFTSELVYRFHFTPKGRLGPAY
jgi:hypothetical protein